MILKLKNREKHVYKIHIEIVKMIILKVYKVISLFEFVILKILVMKLSTYA